MKKIQSPFFQVHFRFNLRRADAGYGNKHLKHVPRINLNFPPPGLLPAKETGMRGSFVTTCRLQEQFCVPAIFFNSSRVNPASKGWQVSRLL